MHTNADPAKNNHGFVRLLPSRAFVSLLAIGLFLRILVLPASGFQTDISSWQNWAQKIRHLGIERAYEPISFLSDNRTPLLLVDHPPINLYYLAFLAHAPFDAAYLHPYFNILVKFPGLLFDCIVLLLLTAIARKLSYAESLVRFIAIAYWLNPGFMYHHSFWGLNESASAAVFLGVVLLFIHGRDRSAIILLVASLALKFQMIIFLPVAVAYAMFRRRDGKEDTDAAPYHGGKQIVRGTFSNIAFLFRRIWLRKNMIFTGLLGGGVILGYLYIPFIASGTFARAFWVFTSSIGRFPHLAQGAYNVWFVIDGLTGFSIPDTTPLFAGLTPRIIGIVLFGTATFINVVLLVKSCIKDYSLHVTRYTLQELFVLSFALQGYSFFMLPTEMHERYIFYAVTFLPLFAWKSNRWYVLYGLMSFTYLANMVLVYNFFHAYWPQATIAHYFVSLLNVLCYGLLWREYVLSVRGTTRHRDLLI